MTVEEEVREWRTAWLRGGTITEFAWVGQDVLAWCSGLHLVFLDVPTNKIRLSALSHESHGASCLSGHFRRRILAYAEKNPKPKIFVHAYPSMKRISTCVKDTSFAYLATAFAGDFLVTLGLLPDFRLTVWAWRTGERITGIDTSICDASDYGQSLKISFFTPRFIAQIGHASGALLSWEMSVCSKTVILKKNEINLPDRAFVRDIAWSPDTPDLLAIADKQGHIYLSNSIGTDIHRIILSQHCNTCPEIEPVLICWYKGGIAVRTTFCQMRYYRQDDSNAWHKTWFAKYQFYPQTITSHPFKNDRLFYATKEGHVTQLTFNDDFKSAETNIKYRNGSKYRFFDLVHPWDEYLVAIDTLSELMVFEAYGGAQIAEFTAETKGNITYMVSHRDYPLIIVCTDKGEVAFISMYRYDEPKVLGKFHMQSRALDYMKFSFSGRYLVVCQRSTGASYFFDVSLKQPICVVSQLDAAMKIIDVLLFDEQDSLKFFVLHGISKVAPIGDKLVYFEIQIESSKARPTPILHAFANNFRHVHYVPNEPNVFVATPYLTKQLRYFKTDNWNELVCYKIVPNEHNLRQVRIYTTRNCLITCGLDGSVTVRRTHLKFSRNLHFVTHHRRDFGVMRATFSSKRDLLLALGVDGSLVIVKRFEMDQEVDPADQYRNLQEFGLTHTVDHKNLIPQDSHVFDADTILRLKINKFLSDPIKSFMDPEASENLTWLEWKEQQKIKKESETFGKKREAVLSDYTNLKNKVIELLNKNENSSDMERLPIAAFALDENFRERSLKKAKDERQDVQNRLESDCLERDRVVHWIQKSFWDQQKVLAQSICGIFDDTEVSNYAMSADVTVSHDLAAFSRFLFQVVRELTNFDDIKPWVMYSKEELQSKFDKRIRMKRIDNENIEFLLELDEEVEPDIENERDMQLFEGLTAQNFIEPNTSCNSQFKVYAFTQHLCDRHNLADDCMKLRQYFNKKFNEMFSIKEREMNLAYERIDRLFFIISELSTMYNESVAKTFNYPEWQGRERPESIIRVSDAEVFSRPYVSPSQQDLLNIQAAEEERRRLALLADDFREKALQAMMDGVLEVRWEDLIKRDIPLPECLMMGKDPEAYTDEDNASIKRYEQEVKNLKEDREKYHKLLHADYIEVTNNLKHGIESFNSRLVEFHALRMKVEAAIQQINLRYVRYLDRHVYQIKEFKEDDEMKATIEDKYRMIAQISEEAELIKNTEQELHSQLEGLLAKDKLMEKRLKNEFPTLGKNSLMVISIQYKRRPRLVLKSESPDDMLDLGKAITSMIRPPYLSSESLDYLKQLENLDVMPQNLPASIETSHWETLVVVRRLKIGHEMKLRSVELGLMWADRLSAAQSQEISRQRLAIESLRSQLRTRRAERLQIELDVQLQLVLKSGQVELCPQSGLVGNVITDALNALLLTRIEIEALNKAILSAGARKLRAIKTSVEFGRGSKHARDERRIEKEIEARRVTLNKTLLDWKSKLEDVSGEVLRIQEKNQRLDESIVRLNVDRCDMELNRDVESEKRERELGGRIFKLVSERAAVIRKLLENYEELLKLRKTRNKLTCEDR
ncbi:hypothetical protein QAD02_005672 [Eretmocerus hayati]|uniref:Uncharacterized protein n=1 Tax=Eretmocerus hayati TaxID=131215 RepID=A0ACC2NT16_9HYME|nr:hypothetical protein QAD02_005672 [Eretmocerus hayati]